MAESVSKTFNNENIVFDAEEHSYELVLPDGQSLRSKISVTEYVQSKFLGCPVDYERILDQIIKNKSYLNNPKYEVVFPLASAELVRKLIKQKWDQIKKENKEMHLLFEAYFNTGEWMVDTPLQREMKEFKIFLEKEFKNFKIVAIEKLLFDRTLMLAGTVRGIFRDIHTEEYVLLGWKRTEVKTLQRTRTLDEFGNRFKDNKLKKLTLQLNVYAELLESVYGLRMSKLMLFIIDPYKKEQGYIFQEVPKLPYIKNHMEELRQNGGFL